MSPRCSPSSRADVLWSPPKGTCPSSSTSREGKLSCAVGVCSLQNKERASCFPAQDSRAAKKEITTNALIVQLGKRHWKRKPLPFSFLALPSISTCFRLTPILPFPLLLHVSGSWYPFSIPSLFFLPSILLFHVSGFCSSSISPLFPSAGWQQNPPTAVAGTWQKMHRRTKTRSALKAKCRWASLNPDLAAAQG